MNVEGAFVSVVIPTYRRHAQLAACLEALARQDYPRGRFEVVVVDDGSDAPPRDVVEKFRERLDIKLIEERHAGPGAARNAGARAARGELLAFTDDDCEPEAGWLRALVAAFAHDMGAAVGGRTINALTRNLCAETSQLILDIVHTHFNRGAQSPTFFPTMNLAVPAAAFHEVGGFDATFLTSEDREFCDRWLRRGLRLSYAPDAVVRHSHMLGLVSLWRQHFGYGRGAARFHRARETQGVPPFKPDLGFYGKIFRAPFAARPHTRAGKLAALMFWAQLANAAGFLYERARKTTVARGAQLR